MDRIGFVLGLISIFLFNTDSWMFWIGLFIMGISAVDIYAKYIISKDEYDQ